MVKEMSEPNFGGFVGGKALDALVQKMQPEHARYLRRGARARGKGNRKKSLTMKPRPPKT